MSTHINNDDEKDKTKKAISDNFWDPYHNNTLRLSKICRQLSFAEGGICWFFLQYDNKLQHYIPTDIKIILVFLVSFFIFDACQYFVLSIYNKIIARLYEYLCNRNVIKNESGITRPEWINSPGNFCFGMKLFCIGMASAILIGKFFFLFFQ